MNAVVPASMAIFARSRAARCSAALFCGARRRVGANRRASERNLYLYIRRL
jgi:hypothetical protein